MTILKSWGGTGLATGPHTTSSVGTGDTAFNSVDAGLTLVADGVRTPCISVPDGSGPVAATWNVTSTSWAFRVYMKFGTGTNTPQFCNAYNASGARILGLDFNSTGKFRLIGIQSGGTKVWWTSATTPASGTWYRCECSYDGPTGNWNVAYYAGDSTTAGDSGSGTEDAGLAIATLSVGRNGSTSTGLLLDDVAISNSTTFLGPAVVTPPPTAKNHYIFNGSVWVASTRKIIA